MQSNELNLGLNLNFDEKNWRVSIASKKSNLRSLKWSKKYYKDIWNSI